MGRLGSGVWFAKGAAWDKTSAQQTCGADPLEAGQQHEPRWSAVTPAHCATPALNKPVKLPQLLNGGGHVITVFLNNVMTIPEHTLTVARPTYCRESRDTPRRRDASP